MADLTVQPVATCSTNVTWSVHVAGSTGTQEIRFERLSPVEQARQRVLYGWTCSCLGFTHRGRCKHVERIKKSDVRCGWNGQLDPGLAPDGQPGEWCCPECGGEVVWMRVAT